jgi:pimeloyl-ACP methyl ester carboxylesterase
MRTIVLVHGAWHGPWCWSPVLARLDERGIPAVPVELGLRDLHLDAGAVTAAIDDVGGPVVLVGHSYGGAVITEAGVHPMVERLVYLCAFAVDEDETLVGVTLDHETQSDLAGSMVLHADGTSTIDPATGAAVFYGHCDPADAERAIALLRPHAGATLTQPTKAVAWRERPTTYVVCGDDRAVAPSLQRELAARIPDVALVEWPDADHSPFLSRPAEVADLLAGLAA